MGPTAKIHPAASGLAIGTCPVWATIVAVSRSSKVTTVAGPDPPSGWMITTACRPPVTIPYSAVVESEGTDCHERPSVETQARSVSASVDSNAATV